MIFIHTINFHSAWFWFGSLIRKANLSEKNSRVVKMALLLTFCEYSVFLLLIVYM